jgi:hypothetical protein
MRSARPLAVFAAALALAAPASAVTRDLPPAPDQLHAFLLRADEPVSHTFSRTPSFAWLPVAGADHYEFELANSPTFNEGTLVWSSASLKTPAASIPYALPWMTGVPYALYARVRAWTADGSGDWSPIFGFNVRWSLLPQPVPTYPGLLSWSTVPGATRYDVWLIEANRQVSTRTNVVDEREYYTFHQQPSWTGTVHWRVRAVRDLYGADQGLPNGLPAVTYGPWSPTYTSANPPVSTGPITLTAAFSDVTSSAAQPEAHRLTPGFAFTGNQGLDGTGYELFRTYVFTDSDCVNVVFRGAIVGSPAYAPRTSVLFNGVSYPGTLALDPTARAAFPLPGSEPPSLMLDGAQVHPTELDSPTSPTVGTDTAGSSGGDTSGTSTSGTSTSGTSTSGTSTSGTSTSGTTTSGTSTSGTTTSGTTTSGSAGSSPGDPSKPATPNTNLPTTPDRVGAPVDLWDTGWPNGRYWWTVVPVKVAQVQETDTVLTADAHRGDTTISVKDASGMSGATIRIGSANVEPATVSSVAGGVVTLTSGLATDHAAGEPVVNPAHAVYQDAELPQDACAAGRVATFGKVSQPVLAGSTSPYVSGLSPTGRLTAAFSGRPSFYGAPLVAWQPAAGADEYEVQWSRTKNPWNPAGERYTYGTSAVLDSVGLTPGSWYYRVRGLDLALPGTATALSWSDPVGFNVAKPMFRIVANGKAAAAAKPSGAYAADSFSIVAPTSWKRATPPMSFYDYLPGSPLTRYRAVKGTATVTVSIGSGRGATSLSAWAQQVADTLTNQDKTLSGPISAVTVKVGGDQARRLTFTEKDASGTHAMRLWVFASATHSGYVLGTGATSAAQIDSIARSFRLTA